MYYNIIWFIYNIHSYFWLSISSKVYKIWLNITKSHRYEISVKMFFFYIQEKTLKETHAILTRIW